jgi:hypothetical protein
VEGDRAWWAGGRHDGGRWTCGAAARAASWGGGREGVARNGYTEDGPRKEITGSGNNSAIESAEKR